jgi:hypothetical protein
MAETQIVRCWGVRLYRRLFRQQLAEASTPLDCILKTIPIDHYCTFTAAKTGYSVTVDANNIVTIKACGTEGATNISISR